MWFDCILIDKLSLEGELETFHVRIEHGERMPVDQLEDIDREYVTADSVDAGTVRVYEFSKVRTSTIQTKTRNIGLDGDDLLLQLDHFGIPVTAGYYICIFPKGWRVVEANVYDPYSNRDNPAENRPYRDVSFFWDPDAAHSCAQFEMLSNRGTFSLGVIARLNPAGSSSSFIERVHPLVVDFSDPRHAEHPHEEAYRDSASEVIESIKKSPAEPDTDRIPPVNVGLSGPSVDLVAWGRYLKNKVRRPKA